MRTVRLAKVAARAEVVRWKRIARRAIRRLAYAAVALVFVLACLVLLHALGFEALTQFGGVAPFWAMLIVFGVDIVLAIVFGILAAGAIADPLEREALALRERSVAELRGSFARDALLGSATSLITRRGGLGASMGTAMVRTLMRRGGRR